MGNPEPLSPAMRAYLRRLDVLLAARGDEAREAAMPATDEALRRAFDERKMVWPPANDRHDAEIDAEEARLRYELGMRKRHDRRKR